jgi:hypothetical protein
VQKKEEKYLINIYFSFYVKYGYKLIWESLTPVVQRWHQLREKFK